MTKSFAELENSIRKLKRQWPGALPREVGEIFEEAEDYLKSLKTSDGKAREAKKNTFDFVGIVNEVLKAHDLLFLGRQLSYHVVTTSDLPKAFGAAEEAHAVLNELLSQSARHAGFGSKLEIELKGVKLREGPVIQISFLYEGKQAEEEARQRVVEQIYGDGANAALSGGLSAVRSLLKRAGGQLWLEFPKENQTAFLFNWPTFDFQAGGLQTRYGTCRYDIWLSDYSKIRQRFGITRARKLVQQIEEFVRSLIRHPVDMVISFPARGMITAIYESQEGAASTVATRISQRLKKEAFRLGRKNVTPVFRYRLSHL